MRRFLLHCSCLCCLLACSHDDDDDDEPVPPPSTNSPPTAIFTVSQSDLAVEVDGRASTDVDGAIVAYQWSWGDGDSGSGAEATHVYDVSGTYTITLTVTDNEGAVDTDQEVVFLTSITRRSDGPPDADLIAERRAVPVAGR